MPTATSIPTEQADLASKLATICSYENWFGPHHPQTLLLTAQVGIACWQAGETRQARALLERAIRDLARVLDQDHEVRLQALVALRDLFEAQRDYERAASAQKELLACQARRLGEEHPETVAARADLARLAFEGLAFDGMAFDGISCGTAL